MTTFYMYSASSLNYVFSTGGSNPSTMTSLPVDPSANTYSQYSTGSVTLATNYQTGSIVMPNGTWDPIDTAVQYGTKLPATTTLFGTTYPKDTLLNVPYAIRGVLANGTEFDMYPVVVVDSSGVVKSIVGVMSSVSLTPGTKYTLSYGGDSVIYEDFGVASSNLQQPLDPKNGIVEGTAGNDTIDGSYTGDPQGDKIDNADNTLAGVAAGGTAGSNDDLVQGFAGNDTIRSGAGNDTVYAGAGADTVDGGAGNDVIFGFGDTLNGADDGANDTLLGNTGSDKLYGGAGNDVLYGDDTLGNSTVSPGNDTIDGGAGNDTIIGGQGGDSVSGGDNDDLIYGDTTTPTDTAGGADTLLGGAGKDTIYGGAGNDTIDGGTDNDTLYGGGGDDTVSGGDGHDFINADSGNDLVFGGAGDDSILGGAGNDTMYGQDGSDTIISAAGDLSDGGADNDVFNLNTTTGGTSTIVGGETTTTGIDFDTINGSTLTGPATVSFTADEAGTYASGGLTTTFTQIEGVVTGSGNDTITAATGVTKSITANTGAGNDLITTGGGDDSINAGAGSDTINGGNGNDTIIAGDGDDDITFGAGDSVSGGAGDDDFTFAPGQTGSGSFTVIGGETSEGTPEDTSNNADDGGVAGDKLDGSALTTGVAVTYTTFEGANVTGGATGTFSEIEKVITGSGNDTIDASNASLTNTGGSIGINIDTGAGNDLITGSGGADSIIAGAGSDTINGGNGNDTIAAGDGDDDITFGAGDSVSGGAGDDDFKLDPAQTGTGGWTVIGGEANEGTPEDISNNADDGGMAGDKLDGSALTNPVTVTYTTVENGGVTGGTTGTFSDIEKVVTGSGDDVIDAGNAALTNGAAGINVDTGAGNDQITGSAGADTIAAGAGNDVISAGAGNDLIDAGTGNDKIDGGAGADTMTGGDGFDTFSVTSGDVITDFNTATGGNITDGNFNNNDLVDLSGYYNAANLIKINAAREAAGLPKYASPLQWLRKDQADGVLNDISTANGFASDFTLTLQGVTGAQLTTDNTKVVCFTEGTLIDTARGPVAIEDLGIGDLVMTRDRGAQPIRWIGQRAIEADELEANPNLRPVRIRAGALGAGLPAADLVVSPQHRVLVRSRIAQRLFGTDEVLVAAKQLCQVDGIDIATDLTRVVYVHMLFDRHEVVTSNGAESESLFTGPEALKSVGAAARDEILAIFPELADRDYQAIPARTLASGRMGRKLAVRHIQNGKALVQ
ncbi:Hint domain-containing protein [Paracoccus sp. p3-h83]|uniref:Hint domain-containing protein n=1 Tax=Paracoccus sp. p3-h83 TaxID=3342805 RepID=UPI0035B89C41